MHYDALRQLTHDRRRTLTGDAQAERLWRETRRRHTRRGRLLLDAARDWLQSDRQTARA